MKTLVLATLLSAASPLLAEPFVSTINREPQTTLAVVGSSTVFRVTFTESVTGVDVTDFTLLKVGAVTGTVASISGSGASYDVTVNGISGFGSLRLDLKHTGTGIVGGGAVALADGFDNGQAIRVGTAAPFGWGSHAAGQISDGTANTLNKPLPTAVDTSGLLAGKNIVQMASGANFTVALSSDNVLYAWGNNGTTGQHGNGTTTPPSPSVPVAVTMSGVLSGKSIVDIATGETGGIVLDSDGKLYTWGGGTSGQLGDNSSANSTTPVAVSTSGALNGKVITDMSGGTGFAVACTSDGGIYTWGGATNGKLGNGTTSGNVATPAKLEGVFTGKRVVAVSAGGTFAAALTSDGRVYTWGNNSQGQLGDGGPVVPSTNNPTPAPVSGTGLPGGKTIARITCTQAAVYALARDGTLYAWGIGALGGLGNGTTANSSVPAQVDVSGVLAGKTIADIAGGNNFALVLTTEGKLYSWGTNASGQLGDGTLDQRNNPIAVDVSASSALNGKTVSYLSDARQPTFMMAGASGAAAPTAPEIAVTETAVGDIADNTGTFSFGTTTVGIPVTKTFTVTNSGDATLNLSGLTPPAGFTITQNFGSSTVPASGGTTTFQITMSAGAVATPSGTLTFTNDDATENPYNFTISGTVNPAPIAVTSLNIANASPTNAAFVNWTLTFPSAVNGLTASNFTLSGAAAAGSGVASPGTSNGGLTWTIPVSTGSTDGPLTLNLANATGLSAAISTSLPFAGQSYTMDKTPPTVQSVTRLTPSGQNTNATTVTFRVTYSEPVSLNNPETARFQVVPVNGSTIVGTVTGVTGTTNTRDVTVNLTSGVGEFKLRVLD